MTASGREAVVLVESGPHGERGWLAMRLALALDMGGLGVTVALLRSGVMWAARDLDASPWLEGDARRDLDGLIGDSGARVVVGERAVRAAGLGQASLREGVELAGEEEITALLERADAVVAL